MRDTLLNMEKINDQSNIIIQARKGSHDAFAALTEPHRAELRAHCYRMMGSLQDAEDMVQECFLRAWRRLETYQERATFRAWLYRIATNVCLDALDKRSRRTLPSQNTNPADPAQPFSPPSLDPIWLDPFPDDFLADIAPSPESHFSQQESVRLAFMIALHALPPSQRAVLLLRDVLDWRAAEVADLLDLTVSAVNSQLNRARKTVRRNYHQAEPDLAPAMNDTVRLKMEQFSQFWESANVDGLVGLLKQDAVFAMPPSVSWYQGTADIGVFLAGQILPAAMPNLWRVQLTRSNGSPALGLYQLNPEDRQYHAFALMVLDFSGKDISALTTFITPQYFSQFGLSEILV